MGHKKHISCNPPVIKFTPIYHKGEIAAKHVYVNGVCSGYIDGLKITEFDEFTSNKDPQYIADMFSATHPVGLLERIKNFIIKICNIKKH